MNNIVANWTKVLREETQTAPCISQATLQVPLCWFIMGVFVSRRAKPHPHLQTPCPFTCCLTRCADSALEFLTRQLSPECSMHDPTPKRSVSTHLSAKLLVKSELRHKSLGDINNTCVMLRLRSSTNVSGNSHFQTLSLSALDLNYCRHLREL